MLPPIYLNTATVMNASLRDKILSAKECGFAALEMWIHEIAPQCLSDEDRAIGAERYGLAATEPDTDIDELRARLSVNELAIDGVIPGSAVLKQWSGELNADLVGRLRQTIQVCASLDVRYLVLPTVAESGSHSQLVDNLQVIGALARERGIRLGLEPIGQTGLLNRVKDALVVLDRAGLDNAAGLVLDTFHFFRAGQTLDDLRDVPVERVMAVQINDAIDLPLSRLYGNRHRQFPGIGIFDVAGFCETLLTNGYNRGFAVEVINPEFWSKVPHKICQRAFETASTVLSAAIGRSVNSGRDETDKNEEREEVECTP